MDTRHFAIVRCAFHTLKPKQQYYDKFMPWQELFRNCQSLFEIETPLNFCVKGNASFIVKFNGTYSNMKFRINGNLAFNGVFNKFTVSSIDMITWDDSESLLAVF